MTDHLRELREQIRSRVRSDEKRCVLQLLAENRLDRSARERALQMARELVARSRQDQDHRGTLDAFLQEFGLSNKEGIALMCLAEALLRVPDAATADKLIAEKVATGDWQQHLGQSQSLFVNASTWGLMLTGKIIRTAELQTNKSWYEDMVNRLGEPIVRRAMLQAMRILGGQYVQGRTIEEAMRRGRSENRAGTCFSFDMLGEGARTKTAADTYFDAYMSAINAIGKANETSDVCTADGISVKLSALHPRYEYAQQRRVMTELLPKLTELASAAKRHNIGFSIDAEEADRLDISLDLFAALAQSSRLQYWDGLGFVVQAYQKRAPLIAHWLIELARQTKRRLMVRLVKGAYWDTEIKHAQELGLDDYPVYTRKANTDLSYQVCAQTLLAAQDQIFPQFATHNAHTIALITELGKNKHYEFQRLHGMGQLLYTQVGKLGGGKTPMVRVYAPVGAHRDLLPYLVRRLLENGANSSFVNRFMDASTSIDTLIRDPLEQVAEHASKRHEKIPLPADLYLASPLPRINARGIDLNSSPDCQGLLAKLPGPGHHHYRGGSRVSGQQVAGDIGVNSPADQTLVGYWSGAGARAIERAFCAALATQSDWDKLGGKSRAALLEKVADLLEKNRAELIALIAYEAGRSIPDAVSEVREAVDFCRYYAQLARRHFATALALAGPTGEANELTLHGRGVFVCISPWNFPLAIFTGQIAAALAAGNSVLAKPAEQTPLVASKAVEIMLQAGIPQEILHLICGGGSVGARLVSDSSVAGVAFTGSTATAKHIQQSLAQKDGPIVPLIAETGGQNAMIVDSTALPEQVVDDVIASAFKSAGQRCSALRVLFLQQDIADPILHMLGGACDELTLGMPWRLETDIGPVIDQNAHDDLSAHIAKMRDSATLIYEYPQHRIPPTGTFVGPHIFELDSLAQLQREIFGPILHVIRYRAKDLPEVIDQINNTGYGLTLGIHSRIESRADYIFNRVNVGNTYVNRNMVGAVVGVNPFGGRALSGTGPKAGGPHYLFRFATEKTLTVNTVATGGNAQLLSLEQ